MSRRKPFLAASLTLNTVALESEKGGWGWPTASTQASSVACSYKRLAGVERLNTCLRTATGRLKPKLEGVGANASKWIS